MVDFLEENSANRRRLRLFGCACCRRVWNLLCREAARRVVEISESYADGEATREELEAYSDHSDFADLQTQLRGEVDRKNQLSLCELYAISSALSLTTFPSGQIRNIIYFTSRDVSENYYPTPRHNEVTGGGGLGWNGLELIEKSKLLRDIFGNPFRNFAFDPAWRTDPVVGIAAKMYETRDFSPMPILADALEDAGCRNKTILRHCRGAGPHVRGCHVVDFILEKS